MLQSLIALQVPFEALSPSQKSAFAHRHSLMVDEQALKRYTNILYFSFNSNYSPLHPRFILIINHRLTPAY